MIKQILTKLKNLLNWITYSEFRESEKLKTKDLITTSAPLITKDLITAEGQLITKDLKTKNYSSLDQKAQSLVKISVGIVQALKTVTLDSKIDDVIVALLSKIYPRFGSIVTTIMLTLEKMIPLWLTQLEVARILLVKLDHSPGTDIDNTPCSGTDDTTATNITNDQLIQIINALNISETKSKEYHLFASKCLYHLNGGANSKLDWTDCKAIVQEYYDNYLKTPTPYNI